jgi:hypothetical protein
MSQTTITGTSTDILRNALTAIVLMCYSQQSSDWVLYAV